MHGGCAASICDNLTSMVLYLHTSGVYGEPWSLLGVSQSIQMLYFAPCPVGSWIDIECQTLTVGKSVAVIQVSAAPLESKMQALKNGGIKVRHLRQGWREWKAP